MKKFTKVCLIICGIFLIVGIIFCIIGAVSGFSSRQFQELVREGAFSIGSEDWDLENSENKEELEADENDWTKNSKVWLADEVKNLDIDFNFGTLIIQPAESNSIEVSVEYRSIWEKYTRSIQWKMDGDTLELENTLDKKILKLFSFESDDAILVIKIPEGKIFNEISMEIGAAEVSFETELAASEIDITVGAGNAVGRENEALTLKADYATLEIGAGSMNLSGIEAAELNAECGAGELNLQNVTAENADVDCGIGQISMEMTGQREDYNYEVNCGIGQVVIGNDSYSGLGQSKQIQNNGSKFMEIDCGIGEIDISFIN